MKKLLLLSIIFSFCIALNNSAHAMAQRSRSPMSAIQFVMPTTAIINNQHIDIATISEAEFTALKGQFNASVVTQDRLVHMRNRANSPPTDPFAGIALFVDSDSGLDSDSE